MKQLTKTGFKSTAIIIALVFNIHAFAKSDDENAPLQIEADQLELHEKENFSIYNGNVKIIKGSLKITGDKIVIKNENARLHNVHITGSPATFFQLNDLDEAINAESKIMNYQAQTGILELKEGAKLLKNKNHFSSEHIIYNTLKDIVKAGSQDSRQGSPDSQKPPRVKITIYPEQKSEQPTKDNSES